MEESTKVGMMRIIPGTLTLDTGDTRAFLKETEVMENERKTQDTDNTILMLENKQWTRYKAIYNIDACAAIDVDGGRVYDDNIYCDNIEVVMDAEDYESGKAIEPTWDAVSEGAFAYASLGDFGLQVGEDVRNGHGDVTEREWTLRDFIVDSAGFEIEIEQHFSISADIVSGPKLVWLHDTSEDETCGCPVCAKDRPIRELDRVVNNLVNVVAYGDDVDSDLPDSPLSAPNRSSIRVTIDNDHLPPGFWNGLAVLRSAHRPINPNRPAFMWIPEVRDHYDRKLDGVEYTLGDVVKAIRSNMDVKFNSIGDATDGPKMYQTSRFPLFKVLNDDNTAKNGGDYVYTPMNDGGSVWTELIPESDLSICLKGYHVTCDPLVWMNSLDNKVYIAGVRGAVPEAESDKIVAQSIAIKENILDIDDNAHPGQLMVTRVMKFWRDTIRPSVESAKAIRNGEKPILPVSGQDVEIVSHDEIENGSVNHPCATAEYHILSWGNISNVNIDGEWPSGVASPHVEVGAMAKKDVSRIMLGHQWGTQNSVINDIQKYAYHAVLSMYLNNWLATDQHHGIYDSAPKSFHDVWEYIASGYVPYFPSKGFGKIILVTVR